MKKLYGFEECNIISNVLGFAIIKHEKGIMCAHRILNQTVITVCLGLNDFERINLENAECNIIRYLVDNFEKYKGELAQEPDLRNIPEIRKRLEECEIISFIYIPSENEFLRNNIVILKKDIEEKKNIIAEDTQREKQLKERIDEQNNIIAEATQREKQLKERIDEQNKRLLDAVELLRKIIEEQNKQIQSKNVF